MSKNLFISNSSKQNLCRLLWTDKSMDFVSSGTFFWPSILSVDFTEILSSKLFITQLMGNVKPWKLSIFTASSSDCKKTESDWNGNLDWRNKNAFTNESWRKVLASQHSSIAFTSRVSNQCSQARTTSEARPITDSTKPENFGRRSDSIEISVRDSV